jgi:5-dehydro-4-deoxyglucarate dehydratase
VKWPPMSPPTMTTPQELRGRFGGVIAFPVTPFRADLSLDVDGLRRNLTHLAKFPFCAVVAAGGTGEVYSLTPDEHRQVVATTVEVFAGKAPVIVGVGFNRAMAVEMAQRAAAAGADGILAFPPYFPGAPDDGMLEYYKAIGAATPLGLLVYSRDWVTYGPDQVARLADAIPTLVGWKDGQGDLRRYQAIRQRVGDRLHWIGGIGDDGVPGYYAIGIRTYTSSIATIAPKLSLELHRLASAGEYDKLNRLMAEYVIPLYELRGRRKGYEVTVMKAAMDLVGLTGGPARPPLPSLRPEELDELRAMLKSWAPVL